MSSSDNSESSANNATCSVPPYKTYGLKNGSISDQVKANIAKTQSAHTKLLKTYKGGKCLISPPSCNRAAPTFPPANGVEVSPISMTGISNDTSQLSMQLQANKASLGSSDWSNTSSSSSSSSGGSRKKKRPSRRYRKRKTKMNKKRKLKRSIRRRMVAGSRKNRSTKGGGKRVKRAGKSRASAKSGKYMTWGCFS